MLGKLGEAFRRLGEPPAETAKRLAETPPLVLDKLAHLEDLWETSRRTLLATMSSLTPARDEFAEHAAALTEFRAKKAELTERRGRLAAPLRDDQIPRGQTIHDRSRNRLPLPEATLASLLEASSATVTRLEARYETEQAYNTAIGRLTTACREWVKARDGAAIHELVAAADAGRPTRPVLPAALPGELEKVRTHLAATSAERRRVEKAGVPIEEARHRAFALVDRIAAEHPLDVSYFFQTAYTENGAYIYGGGVFPPFDTTKPERAFVAALLADTLKARLAAALDVEAQKHALLLTPNERTESLDALDRKTAAAEILEEWLVLQHEAAGLPVVRRENAGAAAVLCTTLA